ncbi:glycosyltransferase family 39 protein [Candidatus Giovannonibacteria bacterium]|nr:glycosyltransferase family 39 protein [Candidatus Giovannonibacteria bacterium]
MANITKSNSGGNAIFRNVPRTPMELLRNSYIIKVYSTMVRNKYLIPALLLAIMFALMFSSSINESATFDEVAHIGAGYTYLKYKDSRLNPEHPPLAKDLAALPLMFMDLKLDLDKPFWTAEDINGRQWAAGAELLYGNGNNPDQIVFWARLPMMLLALLFGWLLFLWVSSLYGRGVGMIALFFYVFSPTFLAHSRYVTTDVAAAFGFFIAIASFLRFLKNQSIWNLVIAGLCLGTALLFKFSLFLAVPIIAFLAVLWVVLESRQDKKFARTFFLMLAKLLAIGIIALALIYLVYLFHVWNYPKDQQLRDAEWVLSGFGMRPLANLDFWLIGHDALRPLGQYLLGLLMVIQRASGGNTTYFWGEVSASGWRSYFPAAYALKETLPFHLLTLLAIYLGIKKIFESRKKSFAAILDWIRNNFVLAASILFISAYWAYSIKGILNIGVRHILPTFPFVYILVSRQLAGWIRRPQAAMQPGSIRDWLGLLYRNFIVPIPKLIFLFLVFLWIFVAAIAAFPHYLSYFNETVGIDNGHYYIVDSNYDWGQDLKRLREILDNDPKFYGEKIYLDYFGGGSPQYYLDGQYVPWWSAKGPPPPGSYFAVSATLLRGATGRWVNGLTIKPEDTYLWLRGQEPFTRAGKSIFIYKIP